MIRGVVFFDVDGTLVPQTSSGRHLAGLLGHAEAVHAAEDGYAAGLITNQQVSVVDAHGWAGRTPGEVSRFLGTLPLLHGIEEVVAWCRDHDLVPVLATLAWHDVGRHLCGRFGFAQACGPRLEVRDGTYTGEVAAHFDEWDKRDFARTVAAELGVDLPQCAAVGDSRSDLPLFAEVGFPIAVNASPAARAGARAVADGNDLRMILPHLARWLAPE